MELKRCGLDLRELDRKNNNGTVTHVTRKARGGREGNSMKELGRGKSQGAKNTGS